MAHARGREWAAARLGVEHEPPKGGQLGAHEQCIARQRVALGEASGGTVNAKHGRVRVHSCEGGRRHPGATTRINHKWRVGSAVFVEPTRRCVKGLNTGPVERGFEKARQVRPRAQREGTHVAVRNPRVVARELREHGLPFHQGFPGVTTRSV